MTDPTPFDLAVDAAYDVLRRADLDSDVVREALVAAAHATVGADIDLAGLSAEQTYQLGLVTGRLITAAEDRGRAHMSPAYSAALDEIYRHREGAAWEVAQLDRVQDYATLPVGARTRLQEIRVRLAGHAQGRVGALYRQHRSEVRKRVLEALGARGTLTRGQWEADVEERGGQG